MKGSVGVHSAFSLMYRLVSQSHLTRGLCLSSDACLTLNIVKFLLADAFYVECLCCVVFCFVFCYVV